MRWVAKACLKANNYFARKGVLTICTSLLNAIRKGFCNGEGFYDLWLFSKGDEKQFWKVNWGLEFRHKACYDHGAMIKTGEVSTIPKMPLTYFWPRPPWKPTPSGFFDLVHVRGLWGIYLGLTMTMYSLVLKVRLVRKEGLWQHT